MKMLHTKMLFTTYFILFYGLVLITNQTALPKDKLSPQKSGNFIYGANYQVTVITDNVPDLSDIDRYLWSITSQFDTPQEKAINIWRWSQRLRKQTSNAVEDGTYVLDPIKLFNSYGHCNCGIISGLNNTFWTKMGWQSHYVQLGDHTVTETSWDDGKTWHMFDDSMSIYVFNQKGEVASVREIEKNPKLYLEHFAPECGTNPVKDINDSQGWRNASDRPVQYDRSLINGVDSFKAPNDIQEFNLLTRWGQRCTMNIRPNEQYTRYFTRLDEQHSDPKFFRLLPNGMDAEKKHGHGNFRANGQWEFFIDFAKPVSKKLVYTKSNLSWNQHGSFPAIHPMKADQPGEVVLKIDAANVITSAIIELQGVRHSNIDVMKLYVSRDGGRNWIDVRSVEHTGKLDSETFSFIDSVAGVTQYFIKIVMNSDNPKHVGLDTISVNTTTQLNRPALPKLTRGVNRVQARVGKPVETLFANLPIQNGKHKETVFKESNIDVNPKYNFYQAMLRPKDAGKPAYVIWRVDTPTPITDFSYGGNVTVYKNNQRVTLSHSWDGKTFVEDFEKTKPDFPRDQMVWLSINADDVPTNAHSVYLRYEFEGGAGSDAPGIQSAIYSVDHKAAFETYAPMEVTYCWTEHRHSGDVTRKHTELITSNQLEYNINVGGYRDPSMKWIRINQQDENASTQKSYGYSDGVDVGADAEPVWERYQWETNLALNQPYQLEGEQSDRNPDGNNDLTDGVVAPPDDYVSEKYMPTIVMFDQDVSPVVTIDLEQPQTVSAVRVYAGQPEVEAYNGYRFAYPDQIQVETSTDGKRWKFAGVVDHDQVFNPPADYVPWEHDDDPMFASLPAGGRLHYGYRILMNEPQQARYIRVSCTCRSGWGVLLSEIQVFDDVQVDTNFPPLVVLPNLQQD